MTCCSRMPLARLPMPQIDIADDAGDAARRAVFARGAHRRDAGDELGLAERFQLLRAVGAVHLAAFHEAGRDDVVAAAEIGQQILEQVAVARPVPQMMVRIDDRQIGFEDLLAALVEPIRPHGGVTARRNRGLGHARLLPGSSSAAATVPRPVGHFHGYFGLPEEAERSSVILGRSRARPTIGVTIGSGKMRSILRGPIRRACDFGARPAERLYRRT